MKANKIILSVLLLCFIGVCFYKARPLPGNLNSKAFQATPADNKHEFKSSTEEVITIRIFTHLNIQAFTISPDIDIYDIVADGKVLFNNNTHPLVKFTYMQDSIEVKTFETNFGKFKSVKLRATTPNRSFKLKLNNPDRKARIYQDNLDISTEGGNLKLVNEIMLDNYIGGVVQAEAGRKSYIEFYKVQSILARTFALSHLQKHVAEGFALCDQTHCQAYFGKTTETDIMKAVNDTRDIVVVDENLNLIDAAFHSNSGGETANSEDVWGKKLSYLRSVNDSFSVKMPNARWERKMAKEDWLSYLKLKHNYPIQDSNARWKAITFRQDTRKPYLEANNVKVPLKNVRTDLQLKSTFFTIIPQGDTLLFKGRGFGHGVGMCQEGAMRMAKLGYKYNTVISFYYQNIQLIDLHKLNFFKDE